MRLDTIKEDQCRRAEEVAPLLERFRHSIWACFECSAMSNTGVSEAFDMAQRVVIYPIGPLFDPDNNELTPSFIAVMARAFRFFDNDCDNLLSEQELNRFQVSLLLVTPPRKHTSRISSHLRHPSQVYCFDVPLDDDEIANLHKTLHLETDGHGLEERPSGVHLNFVGFLGIFNLFVSQHEFEVRSLSLPLLDLISQALTEPA